MTIPEISSMIFNEHFSEFTERIYPRVHNAMNVNYTGQRVVLYYYTWKLLRSGLHHDFFIHNNFRNYFTLYTLLYTIICHGNISQWDLSTQRIGILSSLAVRIYNTRWAHDNLKTYLYTLIKDYMNVHTINMRVYNTYIIYTYIYYILRKNLFVLYIKYINSTKPVYSSHYATICQNTTFCC